VPLNPQLSGLVPTEIHQVCDAERVENVVRVADRPARQSQFCGGGNRSGGVDEVWRATRGTLTVDLSPRGVDPRSPALYRVTVRLSDARFVSKSGAFVDQRDVITLSGFAGVSVV